MQYLMRAVLAVLALVSAGTAALAALLSLSVVDAEMGTDKATGQPVIDVRFDAASTAALAAFTEAHVGRKIVLSIDGEPLMSPVIREPILGGSVEVSGSMTMDDAERLRDRLLAGAPVDVELAEE
jgi:preprotein translocase subunit SecD